MPATDAPVSQQAAIIACLNSSVWFRLRRLGFSISIVSTIVLSGHYLHGLSLQFTDDFAGGLRKTAPAGKTASEYLRAGLFFSMLPILLGIALFALRNWLADTDASGFSHYFVDRLALLYGIVPWVGHWALLSNAFAGDSRISRHLLITGLGLSALALVKLALPLLSSGLAVGLTGWLDLPLSALVIGATLIAHIAEVGLSPAKVRLAAIQDRAEVLTQLGKIETLATEELKAPLPDELR